MNPPVKITVTSDFICPWCYIGEQRLARAVEGLPAGIDVELLWLPFELNPDMPVGGMDRKTYRSGKFGSWERSQALDAGTVAAGATDGIPFAYAAIARTPNTRLAHRLSLLAHRAGKQSEYAAAVLRAYFAEGKDIGDSDVLADIAAGVGLNREEVLAFLEGDEGAMEIRALELFSQDRGIHSVPHIQIGVTTLSSAQPVDTIRTAIIDEAARTPTAAQTDTSKGIAS
ncbi:DsbA family oxidoreductase [Novosphingobium sp. PP1Y]|uniref:DsbA family oxidoreductase n=1 Tax=Novosphingobium sp. PP1Y TaxID=702113 RepID=UPI00020EF8DC|nr:DsbA family oxidoreductase [Novosphingobium sp. PP1Y]CCA90748.1 conserved hypothetical protein [Novosphingobium sp. PP1Y]